MNVESSTMERRCRTYWHICNITFHQRFHYEGNGVIEKDVQKPSVKRCRTDGSIDAETLGKFQLGYSPDFRTYGYDLMPPRMDEDSNGVGTNKFRTSRGACGEEEFGNRWEYFVSRRFLLNQRMVMRERRRVRHLPAITGVNDTTLKL